MTIGLSTASRNALLDAAFTTQLGNAAVLTLYNGTRPATGGTATTALSANTCGTPFAPASSGGVLTANAISNATASASGTATWGRLTTSGGTFVADASAGTSGTDIILNSAVIASGATVSITSAVFTAPNP
jgi:hypothetical protein